MGSLILTDPQVRPPNVSFGTFERPQIAKTTEQSGILFGIKDGSTRVPPFIFFGKKENNRDGRSYLTVQYDSKKDEPLFFHPISKANPDFIHIQLAPNCTVKELRLMYPLQSKIASVLLDSEACGKVNGKNEKANTLRSVCEKFELATTPRPKEIPELDGPNHR